MFPKHKYHEATRPLHHTKSNPRCACYICLDGYEPTLNPQSELMTTELDKLILFLPGLFALHEYEEIIMLAPWLRRNREELRRRFPKVEEVLSSRACFDYSTQTFAIGTLFNFLALSITCFGVVCSESYQLGLALLSGHTIHLLGHILQWLIWGKYVPVIITSLLTLPYCVYSLLQFIKYSLFSSGEILSWVVIGVILAFLCLKISFALMHKVHQYK